MGNPWATILFNIILEIAVRASSMDSTEPSLINRVNCLNIETTSTYCTKATGEVMRLKLQVKMVDLNRKDSP